MNLTNTLIGIWILSIAAAVIVSLNMKKCDTVLNTTTIDTVVVTDTTYIYDTIYLTKTVVKEIPAIVVDTNIYTMTDSIVTDTITIYNNILFNNNTKVFNTETTFSLLLPIKEKIITKNVYIDQPVNVYVPTNGTYGYAEVNTALSEHDLQMGVGIIHINKKDRLIGVKIASSDKTRWVGVQYGLKF